MNKLKEKSAALAAVVEGRSDASGHHDSTMTGGQQRDGSKGAYVPPQQPPETDDVFRNDPWGQQ